MKYSSKKVSDVILESGFGRKVFKAKTTEQSIATLENAFDSVYENSFRVPRELVDEHEETFLKVFDSLDLHNAIAPHTHPLRSLYDFLMASYMMTTVDHVDLRNGEVYQAYVPVSYADYGFDELQGVPKILDMGLDYSVVMNHNGYVFIKKEFIEFKAKVLSDFRRLCVYMKNPGSLNN